MHRDDVTARTDRRTHLHHVHRVPGSRSGCLVFLRRRSHAIAHGRRAVHVVGARAGVGLLESILVLAVARSTYARQKLIVAIEPRLG